MCACGFNAFCGGGHSRLGRVHGDRGRAFAAIDLHLHVLVMDGVGTDFFVQTRERHALACRRRSGTIALRRELAHPRLHGSGKLSGLGHFVDQTPIDGTLTAHAFDAGAENIGMVMAHLAFVCHTRQTAGARQHAQQGYFGQGHAGRAVIHQHNVVTRQGQLITTARTSAIDSGHKFESFVTAGIFHAIARFVGEFAKVHLPSVGR